MVSDQLTFFVSFAVVFGGLGWYLWRLEGEVTALRERLHDAQAKADPGATDRHDAATGKNQDAEQGP